LENLRLKISIETIADKISEDKVVKLKRQNILIEGEWVLHIFPSAKDSKQMFIQLLTLKNLLPGVIVGGITSIQRVVITKDKKNERKLILGIEG